MALRDRAPPKAHWGAYCAVSSALQETIDLLHSGLCSAVAREAYVAVVGVPLRGPGRHAAAFTMGVGGHCFSQITKSLGRARDQHV
jgi:hypothetical protein